MNKISLFHSFATIENGVISMEIRGWIHRENHQTTRAKIVRYATRKMMPQVAISAFPFATDWLIFNEQKDF
jgi:hypothetical protein